MFILVKAVFFISAISLYFLKFTDLKKKINNECLKQIQDKQKIQY
jgi:hypothetical protein